MAKNVFDTRFWITAAIVVVLLWHGWSAELLALVGANRREVLHEYQFFTYVY